MAEGLGLQSVTYSSPAQFFSNIDNLEKNSLLVLDLSMPEMDGIQVMRKLVGVTNIPKLILVSGHDEAVLRSAEKLGRAQGLDIVAALNKPVNLIFFEEAVKKYFEKIDSKKNTH